MKTSILFAALLLAGCGYTVSYDNQVVGTVVWAGHDGAPGCSGMQEVEIRFGGDYETRSNATELTFQVPSSQDFSLLQSMLGKKTQVRVTYNKVVTWCSDRQISHIEVEK